MARNCTFKYTQINSDGKTIPFTTELTKEKKEVITTLRKKDNVNLLFYHLYVFDKNYNLCWLNELYPPSVPMWMVPATPNEKKMQELSASDYDFNKNKTFPPAYVYLSGRELSGVEVELFKTDQTWKNKCITVPANGDEIALDQSFSVWNCYAHKVADPVWKAADLISNLIDLYSGQYKKKENVFTKLLKENRYVIARGGVPVDMMGILIGFYYYCDSGNVLSKHINAVTTDVAVVWGKINATSPDRSVFALWESKIKTSIDPLYMLGILYAKTMIHEFGLSKDAFKTISAQDLLSRIEAFMFESNRDINVLTYFDQTIAADLNAVKPAEDPALASVPILHSAYARKIASTIPKIDTNLLRYYDAGYMSVTKVDADTKKPYLFSQIIPNESYTTFTVYLYDKNGSSTHVETKIFPDPKESDPTQGINLDEPEGIRSYCKIIFTKITDTMDYAKMEEKGQCYKFVAEMAHQVYKNKTFKNAKNYRITFASIAENFANCFNAAIKNDRAITYSQGGDETLDWNGQCNAKPATDCQSFVNTCLYILGATYQNINNQDKYKVTEEAVSKKMKALTKDGNDTPWAIYCKDAKGYHLSEKNPNLTFKCDEPGTNQPGRGLFTIDGSALQKSLIFFVNIYKESFPDYKGKPLEYGTKKFSEFLLYIKTHPVQGLPAGSDTGFSYDITPFYDKSTVTRSYYSNGVRQILSNLYNLFDEPLTDKTGFSFSNALFKENTNNEYEGTVGISRLQKETLETWDKDGHAKSFPHDFTDHVYIVLSGNRIAQSSGDCGVNIHDIVNNDKDWVYNLIKRSPYALQLKYPQK